ncbi:MAG TPA: ATP-binding protein, partial [Bacteroidales bacterium]|nr:ATP-binding protein [Bacteroidales bacterium]
IKVKDSGIGINEENLQELFKDFMRIKSDQTRNISGSGLGLSIVKKIVDLNNGEISVESKLNEGSTFKVVLPV